MLRNLNVYGDILIISVACQVKENFSKTWLNIKVKYLGADLIMFWQFLNFKNRLFMTCKKRALLSFTPDSRVSQTITYIHEYSEFLWSFLSEKYGGGPYYTQVFLWGGGGKNVLCFHLRRSVKFHRQLLIYTNIVPGFMVIFKWKMGVAHYTKVIFILKIKIHAKEFKGRTIHEIRWYTWIYGKSLQDRAKIVKVDCCSGNRAVSSWLRTECGRWSTVNCSNNIQTLSTNCWWDAKSVHVHLREKKNWKVTYSQYTSFAIF